MPGQCFSASVKLLEGYRGRDKIIRTASYVACLAGGLTESNQALSTKFLTITAELNACRMILRLFDDMSMLAYTLSYGWGKKEKDQVLRVMNLLSNLVNQAFFPIEHIAWAAQKGLISANASPWLIRSLVTWIISLCLSILRSFWNIAHARSKYFLAKKSDTEGKVNKSMVVNTYKAELVTIAQNATNLGMAIHWLPGNQLWSGKLSNTAVGVLGIVSSSIGLVKLMSS
uniref:Peroxisomal membrane protein 11C n=1 Tax=Phallusia mammillata TaxID=59560 RepID=A0A6F9DMY2_9ASCI|nr:peroxisomal membrane protein 11C [Phallusia mammillata]